MTGYGLSYFSMLLPIILTALGVILVITLRWFSYRERMALIAQGLTPEQKKGAEEKHKLLLAVGLIVGLVGLALSIGLATIGMGPWLLVGLIPLFTGLALILTSLVLRPEKAKEAENTPPAQREPDDIVLMEEDEDEEEQEEQQLA